MPNIKQPPDEGKALVLATESEKAILGIVLFLPRLLQQVLDANLQPEHFHARHHEHIYQALLALHDDSANISPQAVEARMQAQGTAASLLAHNGCAYLVELQNTATNGDGLADHIKAAQLAATNRQILETRAKLQRSQVSPAEQQALTSRLTTLKTELDALVSAADGWRGEPGAPQPLENAQLARWPEDVLPPWLGEYLDAVCDSQQVPRDLAGILALGCMSVAWAGKVCAALPNTGHAEELCLYLVACADVGERKSSTYAKFLGPVYNYEAERRAELAPKHSDYLAEREGLEQELKAAQTRRSRSARGSDDHGDACDAARRLRQTLDSLPIPPKAEFFTQDCTAEGLARLMSETGGHACLMSPEGGGVFDGMAGKYSDMPNLDVFLKSYDGERLINHRAAKERTIPPIERPSLVITVTTQPATLRRLVSRQELDDRGLVARMLFGMASASRVGHREPHKPAIPTHLSERYAAALRTALQVSRPNTPHFLTLSADGLAEYTALFSRIEPRLGPSGDLHAMRGWACKLVGKIMRIAALIHLMEHLDSAEPWTIPLSGDTFRRSAKLADYFIEHASRAFSIMRQSPHIDGARKLLAVLRQDRKAHFTTRDAHRIVDRNSSRDATRPVLDCLQQHNFIAPQKSQRTTSERWQVNPLHVQSWTE